MGPHRVDVDGHPNRDEEQADQEPLERRDIDFDLVAVFGLGQQKTGEKSAECGREARGTGGGGNPHHHEQRDRHDEIAAAGLRREAEDRLQHVTAGREDGDDRKHRLQQGRGERTPRRSARRAQGSARRTGPAQP